MRWCEKRRGRCVILRSQGVLVVPEDGVWKFVREGVIEGKGLLRVSRKSRVGFLVKELFWEDLWGSLYVTVKEKYCGAYVDLC